MQNAAQTNREHLQHKDTDTKVLDSKQQQKHPVQHRPDPSGQEILEQVVALHSQADCRHQAGDTVNKIDFLSPPEGKQKQVIDAHKQYSAQGKCNQEPLPENVMEQHCVTADEKWVKYAAPIHMVIGSLDHQLHHTVPGHYGQKVISYSGSGMDSRIPRMPGLESFCSIDPDDGRGHDLRHIEKQRPVAVCPDMQAVCGISQPWISQINPWSGQGDILLPLCQSLFKDRRSIEPSVIKLPFPVQRIDVRLKIRLAKIQYPRHRLRPFCDKWLGCGKKHGDADRQY